MTRLTKRGDQREMIAQRVASPEYERDLRLPTALADQAQVIVNDDWLVAQRQLDQIMQNYGLTKSADLI